MKRRTLESACKGLVRPVLENSSSVWDPEVYFYKINLRRCRKVQLDSRKESLDSKCIKKV